MYRYPAKPTEVNGYWYDSRLEARCARLLIENRIPFTPHARFDMYDTRGQPMVYIVDFLLGTPLRIVGCSYPVSAIEVKGRLTRHDLVRVGGLSYFFGIKCFVALEPVIDCWEREGLLP